MDWEGHVVHGEAVLILLLYHHLMVLGFPQLVSDFLGVHEDAFFDALVHQFLLLHSLLLWELNHVDCNLLDDTTLLPSHGAKNEFEANLLVLILDCEQFRLVNVLLLVGLEGVYSLEVELELVELGVVE